MAEGGAVAPEGDNPAPAVSTTTGEKKFVLSIINTETVNDEGKPYTTYETVFKIGETTTTLKKRYSEFRNLHDAIVKKFGAKRIPEFPPKKMLGVLESEFVKKRRSALEAYLSVLSQQEEIVECEEMTRFWNSETRSANSDFFKECDKCGFLYKQGRFLKQWKRRWFVLKNNDLYFFKSEVDSVCKGVINLDGCSFVTDKRANRDFVIGIFHPKNRGCFISTDTEAELHAWMSAIEKEEAKVSLEDFELLTVVGKGSFGKVIQVRKKDNDQIYAMKVLRKDAVRQRNQIEHTRTERQLLQRIRHPFLVDLKYAFQTDDKLYMVLDFVNGGELFSHLKRERRFTEERARLYASEVLVALEYLHSMDVIYRDLKPENVLMDCDGHVRLTDFGLSKMVSGQKSTYTFCGTPEYMAPEILMDEGHGKAVDWWSLGILIYEMLVGLPPFYSRNKKEMYFKILKCELRFPTYISEDARSLLQSLLARDPATRLGSSAEDGEAIRAHPWFSSMDWDRLLSREIEPTFKPNVKDIHDFSNFDPAFTKEAPTISPTEGSAVAEAGSKDFAGFTYAPQSLLDASGGDEDEEEEEETE